MIPSYNNKILRNADALFVDVGGVLLRPNFKLIQEACGDFAPTEQEIDQALYVHGAVGAGLGPGDDDDAFVFNFALSAGIPKHVVEQQFATLRHIVLFAPWIPRYLDETIKALNAIKRVVQHIVIVSNTEYGGVRDLLAQLGICQIGTGKGVEVSAIIDSAEIGIHKPDPRIYKHSADLINVSINKCVHVGDSIRNDVDCMNAAGGLGIHFAPYLTCKDKSHLHVEELIELLGDAPNGL